MTNTMKNSAGTLIEMQTPYEKWQATEGIRSHKGFAADLNTLKVDPWPRKAARGAFINLADQESLDAYVLEIPPGSKTAPQRHMFEEAIYVLSGRGATTVWYDGLPKRTFEWQAGSLFSPPLNAWYEHYNGAGDMPARYVAVTSAPHMINLFHDTEYIFNNPYVFANRFRGEENYFNSEGVRLAVKLPESEGARTKNRIETYWKTNFMADVPNFNSLADQKHMFGEGRARIIFFGLSDNTMSGHILEFVSGSYKKAHRHGPGAHIIILSGSGYSLVWPEGGEVSRVDWRAGVIISPPDNWYHQHFATGKAPARHLALRWGSLEYPGVTNWRKYQENFGEQIEYEDEDPSIRETFVHDCLANGVAVRMDPVVYRRRK